MLPLKTDPEARCPTRSTARLLVVDDHPIVRDGLVQLLGRAPGLVVVTAVGSQEEARQAVRQHEVDLALVDLMIGASDSLALISELVAERPTLKVLVVSALSQSVYAERALRAGAAGYIMKSAETPELLLAISSVLEGRVYLCPKIFVSLFRGVLHRSAAASSSGAAGLSDRELQVFQLIGAGLPNREIARNLGISVKTVETHRENLKVKLGLNNSSELAASAQDFVASLAASD